jgi:hypothetical protein
MNLQLACSKLSAQLPGKLSGKLSAQLPSKLSAQLSAPIDRIRCSWRDLGWGAALAIAPLAITSPASAAIAPQPSTPAAAHSPSRMIALSAAPAQIPTTFDWFTGDNQQPGDPSAGGSRGSNGEEWSGDQWGRWVQDLPAVLTGKQVGQACVLVPADSMATIAGDQPFLIVQGSLPAVSLRQDTATTPVWQSSGGDSGGRGWAIARYPNDAPSLIRGTAYRWVWASGEMTVTLLDANAKATLDQNLLTLLGELDLAGASFEESTYERAQLYSAAGLWLDAVQAMLLIPDPSPELTQAREQLFTQFCSPDRLGS